MKDKEDHFIKPEKRPITPKLHILCGLFPGMDKELKRKCVTLLLLWEEYKLKHPDGYTKASSSITLASGKHNQSRMHIAHKAGDKLYVDFAGHKLVFLITIFKTKYILLDKALRLCVFCVLLDAHGCTYRVAHAELTYLF